MHSLFSTKSRALSHFFMFSFLFLNLACMGNENITVRIQNLNTKIKFHNAITYEDTLITNLTSAHLLTLDRNLNIKKDVLKGVIKKSPSHYILQLNQSYRSFRGEPLNAKDVVDTFKFYITHHPETLRVFSTIQGSESCKKNNCADLKVNQLSPFEVEIRLLEDNPHFVEDLSSPVFILFKSGRPRHEKIGNCLFPYQTGKGQVIACGENSITIQTESRKFKIVSPNYPGEAYEISSKATGEKKAPSLTTSFFLSNPNSKQDVRTFLKDLGRHSQELASLLKIPHTKTLTSPWMGLDNDGFKLDYDKSKIKTISIVTVPSIPNVHLVQSFIQEKYPHLRVNFKVVPAHKLFEQLQVMDIALLWLSPGYFDFYDMISIFDCDPNRLCWFDYKDKNLQRDIRALRSPHQRYTAKDKLLKIEKHLQTNGYIAPVGLVNWWLIKDEKKLLTHPSGVFQLNLSQLNYD